MNKNIYKCSSIAWIAASSAPVSTQLPQRISLFKEVWLRSAGSSPVDFHFLHRDYPVEDSMKYIFEVIITPVVMFAKYGEYYYCRVGG